MMDGSTFEGAKALSHRERDDAYFRLIYAKGDWRVIACKDNLQWIIQRAEKRRGQREWTGNSYCSTRKALTRLWHAKTGDVHGMIELSKMLSERIGGEGA